MHSRQVSEDGCDWVGGKMAVFEHSSSFVLENQESVILGLPPSPTLDPQCITICIRFGVREVDDVA